MLYFYGEIFFIKKLQYQLNLPYLQQSACIYLITLDFLVDYLNSPIT